MTIPEGALRLMTALRAKGYAAYIVGGCVRDGIMGRAPGDWDVCTSATPEQMKEALAGWRTVDTGIKHGTLTVLCGGMAIETTTFRVDGGYADHRRPDSVRFVARVEDDLSRRDFTVNAMAYHPDEGLIDPFGGRADIRAKIIRCVGAPLARFDEDALRILRAVRFASVLRFSIENQTEFAMRQKLPLLANVSAERVLAETRKLLLGDGAGVVLAQYPDVIACALGIPEQAVSSETARAIDRAPADAAIRFALLLNQSDARCALRRLHADNATVDAVSALCARRNDDVPFNEAGMRRLLRDAGTDTARRLLLLKEAAGGKDMPRARAVLQKVISEGQCFSLKALRINGGVLAELGVPAGRETGRALNTLLEEVIDGALPNEEAALRARARELTDGGAKRYNKEKE